MVVVEPSILDVKIISGDLDTKVSLKINMAAYVFKIQTLFIYSVYL